MRMLWAIRPASTMCWTRSQRIWESLTAQQQEAQEEVKRPFAQEQELTDKTNRLNVLRLALHMDDSEKPQPEHTEEKPSIRGMLKRMGMESAATAAAPGRSHSQEAELA